MTDWPALDQVLRTTAEPCRYYTDREVHAALAKAPAEYFAHVRGILRNIAAGSAELELPPKQLFDDPDDGGDFRVMPCVVKQGGRTWKTVKVVGTNLRQVTVPDQITVGKALAIHPEENFISHIFDACLLSSARTGICVALAVDQLAATPRSFSVVGAGRVGYYAAFYLLSLHPGASLALFDHTPGRAAQTAGLLARQFPGSVCRASTTPVMAGVDVLVLATSSKAAFCGPDQCEAPLVISVGADSDQQHELAPGWVGAADIYVDSMDSLNFGDLHQWMLAGSLRPQEVTDFFSLLATGPQGRKERAVFISTGSALFDNVTISYIIGQEDGRG
jgi:ornithine cyclodeaminase/alanine dehydrogenase-like protein (mu-crystallin family)